MNLSFRQPAIDSYRVEVSGWNISQSFFVEKPELEWNEENEKQITLSSLESRIPPLLTPGAAEALAVKIYRQVRTGTSALEDVLAESLTEYQSPIAPEVMAFQIQIAASEATALEFVAAVFRRKSSQ
jgi:hypothetical protein